MSVPMEQYKEICRNYFRRRYAERKQSASLAAFAVPANSHLDDMMPLLLSDTAFYQARVHIFECLEGSLGSLIWEMLGTEPEDVMMLCNDFNSHKAESRRKLSRRYDTWRTQSVRSGHAAQPSQVILSWEAFLNNLPPRETDVLVRSLMTEIQRYDKLFPDMKQLHSLPLSRYGGDYVLPLEYGMMLYLEEQWPLLTSVFLDHALHRMPETFGLPEKSSSGKIRSRMDETITLDDDEHRRRPGSVHMLFSAAGTGKSRQMMEHLQNHWGFYLVSPSLPPSSTSTPCGSGGESIAAKQSLFGSRRSFASKDTYTLYEDLPMINSRWDGNVFRISEPLCVVRFALLREFLVKRPQGTPAEWLWLQISCVPFDMFDALLRCFRLFAPTYLESSWETNIGMGLPGDWVQLCQEIVNDRVSLNEAASSSLFFCLDEAQEALADRKALTVVAHWYKTLLQVYTLSISEALSITTSPHSFDPPRVEAARGHHARRASSSTDGGETAVSTGSGEFLFVDPILIFAGTALDADKMTSFVNSALMECFTPDVPPPSSWANCTLHDEFDLVSSDDQFWQLYEQHLTGILNEHSANASRLNNATDLSQLPLMTRSGQPLVIEETTGKVNHDLSTHGTWLLEATRLPPFEKMIKLIVEIPIVKDEGTSPPESLDNILDRKDSPSVTAALSQWIVEPIRSGKGVGSERKTGFVAELPNLLAQYGCVSVEEVERMILQTPREQSRRTSPRWRRECEDLHTGLRSLYLRQLILDGSRAHRGRFRWSTLYIERPLLSLLSSPRKEDSIASWRLLIDEASTAAAHAAIKALQDQLHKIKRAGRMALLQDLFRAGIRAEIASRPTIFLDQRYAQLVTYGFALVRRVDEATVQYELAEWIAVRAIMSYLRTHAENGYQELMLQSLIHTQDDYEVQAMFGKATEWFIAAAFDTLLRDQPENNILFQPHRRRALLACFDEAVASNGRDTLGSILRVEHFCLPQARDIYEDRALNTIWEWVKAYRSPDRRRAPPPFYFPTIHAGPDLMFVLEAKNGNNHPRPADRPRRHTRSSHREKSASAVLVAEQIKTGKTTINEAMKTLVVSDWHGTAGANTQGHNELREWDGPIVLVAICTGSDIGPSQMKRWLEKNTTRVKANQYFCILDRSKTESIWGQEFSKLATSIKAKR